MTDIVKRLKQINDESLIMEVVNDCMDAAEEIQMLRAECAQKSDALKKIRTVALKEEPLPSAKAQAAAKAQE